MGKGSERPIRSEPSDIRSNFLLRLNLAMYSQLPAINLPSLDSFDEDYNLVKSELGKEALDGIRKMAFSYAFGISRHYKYKDISVLTHIGIESLLRFYAGRIRVFRSKGISHSPYYEVDCDELEAIAGKALMKENAMLNSFTRPMIRHISGYDPIIVQ